MSDVAIRIENVGKAYRIGMKEAVHDTLGGALASWAKAPLRNLRNLRNLNTYALNGEDEDVIWALRDVSFDVKHGEAVGLIGRNGAGKSTLLKVLSRITEPTTGRITLNGRVASLLEVGTGFHPELTGRENVYMNGTILGMTKREIDRKFDEIVAFSEIERFIDTPVKRYSSGMKVRLAFSVAAHLEPEILLVDEVLAVGDVAFQKKCLGKMDDVAHEGRTVIFVSHHMSMIQALCQRGIVLDRGQVALDANTEEAIPRYLRSMGAGLVRSDLAALSDERAGDGTFRIIGIRTLDAEGLPSDHHVAGSPLTIEIDYERRGSIHQPQFKVTLHNEHELPITMLSFEATGFEILERVEAGTVVCRIPRLPLQLGWYSISVQVWAGRHMADHAPRVTSFNVTSSVFFPSGALPSRRYCTILIDHEWDHQCEFTLNPF